MSRASLDKNPAAVAAMFDRTAERYDLLNDVLSGGQDRLWRRAVARAVGARPGEMLLDLAAGTGSSTAHFARSGARCVACDFSLGMVRVGVQRRGQGVGGLDFVAGDALRLPFRDASFDVATISFGLRNVADVDQALRELLRVVRPGGRLVICEFSQPPNEILRLFYNQYLMKVIPVLARLSSNPEAYTYLSESISDWPAQEGLAARMHAAGWESVGWRNLSFGAVALHRARRPGTGA
jgi:demethylmenaquinone methyltransferase / 2-methoxy-6-polyprenyl-1,4-benzoquinol methylase